MSKTCGNCKHWGAKDHAFHDDAKPGGWHTQWTPLQCKIAEADTRQWRYCDRIVMAPAVDDPAYVMDGSFYHASLRTREDFSCSLHEASDG